MVSKRVALTCNNSLTRLPFVRASVAKAAAYKVPRYNASGSNSLAPVDIAWRNQTLLRLGGASRPGRLRHSTVCDGLVSASSASDEAGAGVKTGQFAKISPHQSNCSGDPSYWRK